MSTRFLPGRIDPRSVELRTDMTKAVDDVPFPNNSKIGAGMKEGYIPQAETTKVVSKLGAVVAVMVYRAATSIQSGVRAV